MRHSPMFSVAQVVPVTTSEMQLMKDRPLVYFSWGSRLVVSHDVTRVFSKYRLPPYPRICSLTINQTGRVDMQAVSANKEHNVRHHALGPF